MLGNAATRATLSYPGERLDRGPGISSSEGNQMRTTYKAFIAIVGLLTVFVGIVASYGYQRNPAAGATAQRPGGTQRPAAAIRDVRRTITRVGGGSGRVDQRRLYQASWAEVYDAGGGA
jgi:hypothetical protein